MSLHRVKRPCKICLQSVNNKTGLQCKGACRKWAHFTCLEYSASKIESIKAGDLIIICPCPNCNTGMANPPKSSCLMDRQSISDVPASKCSSQVKCQNADSGSGLPTCPISPKVSAPLVSSLKPTNTLLCPLKPEPSLNPPNVLVCTNKRCKSPSCPPKTPASLQSHLKQSSSSPSSPERPGSPACRPKGDTSPPKRPVSPALPSKWFASLSKRPLTFTQRPKRIASPPRPIELCPVPPIPAPTAVSAPSVKDCKRTSLRKSISCCCGVYHKDEILETSFTKCAKSDLSITKCKEKRLALCSNIEQLCNTVCLLSAQIKEMVGRLAKH